MKRLLPPFVVLLALSLLGSDSPKAYDDRTEIIDSLQGTWHLHRIGGPGKRAV